MLQETRYLRAKAGVPHADPARHPTRIAATTAQNKRAIESLPEGDPLRAKIDEKIKTAKERVEGGSPRGLRGNASRWIARPGPAPWLSGGPAAGRLRGR